MNEGMKEVEEEIWGERATKDYIKGLLYGVVEDTGVDYEQVALNLIELAKRSKDKTEKYEEGQFTQNIDVLQKIVLGHIADFCTRENRQHEVVKVSVKIADYLRKNL